MVPKAWSHSSLSDFESCPRAYYEKRIAKSVQDTQGVAAAWGEQVHKYFECDVKRRNGAQLTEEEAKFIATNSPNFASAVPWLDTLFEMQADIVHPELELAIDKAFKPCAWDAPEVWCRGIIDVLLIKGTRARALDWKGLALDTPLPTPSGWTTMGGVQVGDRLFSKSGEQCTVVGKSQVKQVRCYEVSFDDTSKVTCDEEHLWELEGGEVLGVQDVPVGSHIRIAEPLSTPDVPLLIDPYVFGVWLADGKHTSGEITKPDAWVWDEIQRRGYSLSHDYSERAQDGKCRAHTVYGLRGQLKAMGVLGNKHIPPPYLRSGYSQRLALLQGLMDGDGNANPSRKQAVFTTVNEALSGQVVELLLSLGQRPNQSTVSAHGFGVTTTAYPIAFRPIGINPFLLPRKRDRIRPSWGAGRSGTRRVVAIVGVPTQCIAVDSLDHTFLCSRNMIPTHNTGKRKPDSRQLKLFALLIFAHFPEIVQCKTDFIWLKTNEIDSAVYTREQEGELWKEFLPLLTQYKVAFKTGVFPPKRSGLCNGWCPVTGCENWRPKRG